MVTVKEAVNAQGFAKGLAHTEPADRGAVPYALQQGLQKGRRRRQESPVPRRRCRGMKPEGAPEWLKVALPVGMAGKESGAWAGLPPERVYTGPGAGI